MRLRVSRYVFFQWRDGQLICDIPLHGRQVALREPAWELLQRLRDWVDPGTLDDPRRTLAEQLLGRRILVVEGSAEHRVEEERNVWRRWGAAATHYHLAARTDETTRYLSAAEDTLRLRDHAAVRPPPCRPATGTLLPLPEPPPPVMDLAEALRRRRTGRRLDPGRPVPLAALAALLHWTARPLHRVGLGDFGTAVLKAVPSAGSCHPIEVYPLVVNVAGIEPGIYRYAPGEHALEALPAAPPAGDELLRWCGDQTFVANAGVLLLYTAVLERTAWKYPTGRSYGSLHLDLGHVSQNAYLVGTALGLGVFFTAATRDALVEEALGVSWTEEVFLGLTGVGVLTDEEARRQRAMADGGPAAFSSPADAWDGLG